MERIKALDRYQKVVLIFITAMVLVFTVVYSTTIARVGFSYKDEILVPSQENGTTVYSGKIKGKQARFTVFADKTVEFQYSDKTYGPYTAKEDETAIPENNEFGEYMTGVELRKGEEILFRGGMVDQVEYRWLYNEDGSLEVAGISYVTGAGIEIDEYGNGVDSIEPSAGAVLTLMAGPELTHKGDWIAWGAGVFICMITAISILFADELFYWNLSFRIRSAERAEPSEWEIASRYISWTILPILTLILFAIGLR